MHCSTLWPNALCLSSKRPNRRTHCANGFYCRFSYILFYRIYAGTPYTNAHTHTRHHQFIIGFTLASDLGARLIHHSYRSNAHTHTRTRYTSQQEDGPMACHGANGVRPLSLRRDRWCADVCAAWRSDGGRACAIWLCGIHCVFQSHARLTSIGCRAVHESLVADWLPVDTRARGVSLVISLPLMDVCVSWPVVGVIPTLFSMQFDATLLVVCVGNGRTAEMKNVLGLMNK